MVWFFLFLTLLLAFATTVFRGMVDRDFMTSTASQRLAATALEFATAMSGLLFGEELWRIMH